MSPLSGRVEQMSKIRLHEALASQGFKVKHTDLSKTDPVKELEQRMLQLCQVEKIVAAFVGGPTITNLNDEEKKKITEAPIHHYDGNNPLLKTIAQLIIETQRRIGTLQQHNEKSKAN
jgi:hypothetical protein